jgi:hypothetical protein
MDVTPQPERVPTGTRPRNRPGAPWWRYQRPDDVTGRAPASSVPTSFTADEVMPLQPALAPASSSTSAAPSTDAPTPAGPTTDAAFVGSPMPFAVLAGFVALIAIGFGQFASSGVLERILVCGFGLAAAAALARFVQARHPEEPWIGRFIIWGMVVKLVGTGIRYYTFLGSGKRSDAYVYGRYALDYVHGTATPLPDLRKTNFIYFLTGHIYALAGPDLIGAFFVYSIGAFFGGYLWYRAATYAVPNLDRKMYCALVLFVPSLTFWPSSVGKEAVMLLALGLVALGVAYLLTQRVIQGLLVAAPGGYLLWAVRPHLLAFATVAAGAAFLIARGSSSTAVSALFRRPVGLVVLVLLGVFAMNQATEFLGMKDFSLSSIETELATQSGRTDQGGSATGDRSQDTETKVHLTPLSVPQGAVTVLLRPFPWEVDSATQILACIESAFFAYLVVVRRKSIAASLRLSRTSPYLFFCWVMIAFYAVAFASFANMGLLVRQRSLILPAFFVLLCLLPSAGDGGERVDEAPSAPTLT